MLLLFNGTLALYSAVETYDGKSSSANLKENFPVVFNFSMAFYLRSAMHMHMTL